MITVPSGLVGLGFTKDMFDPTTGNRTQWFTYDQLTINTEAPAGTLAGVTGGQLEWHANAAVKGGGKINVAAKSLIDAHPAHFLHIRIKVTMHIDGLGKFPLGVFIPSVPTEKWDDSGVTYEIELLDKCSILDNDYVLNTYSLPKDTVITDAVVSLIEGVGERAGSITRHPEITLKNAMTWEAGTSKLSIINDLLDAGNFFSLSVDGNGAFRVQKYYPPRDRPTVHKFYDDAKSIYVPEFAYEKDYYSVPNRVVLIGQGDGEEEAMVAVATNENPDSLFSRQSRGFWITDVQKGIEAADQATLDDKAKRRLAQLTSPTGMVTIDHAPLPWLNVNDVVRFRRSMADIDVRATVSSTQLRLDPTALQHTQLQEVYEF